MLALLCFRVAAEFSVNKDLCNNPHLAPVIVLTIDARYRKVFNGV